MTTFSVILVSAAALNAAGDNVLLDFSATWCGPCQQMSPIVSRLKRQGYPIRKVDVDREPALARKYGIGSIPAFVLVVQGKEVARIEGMTSESRLRSLLAKIPRPSEPAKQPPIPREKPVIRAKHDSREPAATAATLVDPLAASVRIRVRNEGGANFGSGTVIDSRPGRTIVLTCGHIFRGLRQGATTEVDVFTGGRHETFVGNVVLYDTLSDVGLCAIPTDTTLPVSQVAATTARVAKGDHVFSIGCGGGDPPTKQQLRVTALNRYLGPDNIECSGVPEEGRSGGGLFNRSGEVVGVCIAADLRDRRGLYAGLSTIHKLLDQAKLSQLHQQPASLAKSLARSDEPRTELAAGSSASEAEVVCIIRPLDNPQAASRVVIINRASPKFVAYLTREIQSQPQPVMHSVRFSALSRAGARHHAHPRRPQRYQRSAESR